MEAWLTPLISGAAGMSVLTLLLLAALPLLSRRYRQSTLYGLLILCLLGFLILGEGRHLSGQLLIFFLNAL